MQAPHPVGHVILCCHMARTSRPPILTEDDAATAAAFGTIPNGWSETLPITSSLASAYLNQNADGLSLTERLTEIAPSARSPLLSASFRAQALAVTEDARLEVVQKPAKAIVAWLESA